jgi:hypothetical protein
VGNTREDETSVVLQVVPSTTGLDDMRLLIGHIAGELKRNRVYLRTVKRVDIQQE